MHNWQETDLPVLSREGGLEENVQEPVGKAPHTFRSTLGFHSLLCCVVTSYSNYCTNYLLYFTVRVITNCCNFASQLFKQNINDSVLCTNIIMKNYDCKDDLKNCYSFSMVARIYDSKQIDQSSPKVLLKNKVCLLQLINPR